MQDDRIENRKIRFQKVNFDILQTRENFKLSLRKEKMDQFFNSKRQIKVNPHIELEINPSNLTIKEEYRKFVAKNLEEEINFIKDLVNSSNQDDIKFGIYSARKYLCTDITSNIDFMLSKGILQKFIELLQTSKDDIITYECLWCLIQLTSVNLHANYKLLLNQKFLETLQNLMENKRPEIVEMNLNLIGNFLIENIEIKNEILNSNLFKAIVNLIDKENNSINISQQLAFLISNIVNQNKPALSEQILKYCQDLLFKLLNIQDRKVILDCIWGLSYTTDTDYESLTKNLYDTGIIHKLLQINFDELPEFKVPSIRIFGNMVSLDHTITEEMIKLGLLDKMNILLKDKTKQIVREATWVISNITAGTKNQIETVIKNTEIFNRLILLTKDIEFSIKMEAVNALSFACSGSDFSLCLILINSKIFETYIDILSSNTELKIILTVLEGIENIFQQGEIMKQINQINPFAKKFDDLGGVNYLNHLQKFKNETIYHTAIRILEKYFSYLIVND